MSVDDNLFPPYELLKEELAERGWDAARFAQESGLNLSLADSILNGAPISEPAAAAIGRALGTGPELWLNLQRMHKLDLARNEPAKFD